MARAPAAQGSSAGGGGDPRRGTYSIVARDPETGEIGAAVQSHWFSVGSIVTWASPGVGAVATQSVAEPGYGPRLLERLRAGQAPADALRELLAADDAARFRQVGVCDAEGRTAVHTGEGCIAFAGHVEGEGSSAQANMMASPEVWPRMTEAFRAAEGPLPRRLLTALEAGEQAGGDARGRQSAALLVVPGAGEPWSTVADLRVEDHPEPLLELKRLLDLRDAYELATEGDDLIGEGRHAEAGERYLAAVALAPDNHELIFWAGLALAQAGDLEGGVERVRRAIDMQPGWRDLLARLEPEIAPAAVAVRRALDVDPATRSPG
jgi:uncharacterized Ntn-hydrolase superfamily protein